MKLFINRLTNKVILAKTRKDAGLKFGLSIRQTANEINLFDPQTDKKAMIPQELLQAVEMFKQQRNQFS